MARLPFTQVSDAFVLAPRLAGLLRVDALQALGLLVKLDREAIEVSEPNGCPTGHFRGRGAAFQVAGAVGWPVDRAAELVQALADIDKVDLSDGVRVLGLGWAVKAWESQQEGARKKAEYRAQKAAEKAAEKAGRMPGTRMSWGRPRDMRRTSAGQQRPGAGTAKVRRRRRRRRRRRKNYYLRGQGPMRRLISVPRPNLHPHQWLASASSPNVSNWLLS